MIDRVDRQIIRRVQQGVPLAPAPYSLIAAEIGIAEEELLARRDKDGKVKYLSAEKTERKPNDELLKKGKVYFAQSPHERKATGTHYTAEDLVERLVKQTVLAEGLRPDLPEAERLALYSGHSLRAGLARHAEVPEAAVQKHLGHASAEMTRRYQRRRDRFG